VLATTASEGGVASGQIDQVIEVGTRQIDEAAACSGRRWEIRAARISKGAIAFSPHVSVDMQVMLVDGQVGLV
jgi:hypothetical protein